jgi:hypothetical protein
VIVVVEKGKQTKKPSLVAFFLLDSITCVTKNNRMLAAGVYCSGKVTFPLDAL